MKKIVLLILVIPSITFGNDYICSYPNYTNGDPVILKIKISGENAYIRSGQLKSDYKVLENNKYGVVMVRSFSSEALFYPKQNDVGLFGLVIDKEKMKMIRGNISYGDTENSLRTGTCSR